MLISMSFSVEKSLKEKDLTQITSNIAFNAQEDEVSVLNEELLFDKFYYNTRFADSDFSMHELRSTHHLLPLFNFETLL